MKEIKFRGRFWNKDNLDASECEYRDGEFIYGGYARLENNIGTGDYIVAASGICHLVYPDSVAQFLGHDSNGVEIYEGDIYFDGDTQTQTHAPCIDDLVNEALGDNFVSLNYHEMERAKKTLVEATS